MAMAAVSNLLPQVLEKFENEILQDWMAEQLSAVTLRADLMREADLRHQSATFLEALRAALASTNRKGGQGTPDINTEDWKSVRHVLDNVSKHRIQKGFSPAETATFVFSLKQPLFKRLGEQLSASDELVPELWYVTVLLDRLGLYTAEVYQKAREDVIRRQQEEMLELSTPVVKLWDKILALPMIGTLDSARTQVVMESLLQKIVETGSEIAIIDITGVPTVDTLVAQHLLKTVAAARLMGADCIISGIRPQIAQTMVHLAVDLTDVSTKANLSDAFILALQRLGHIVQHAAKVEEQAHARPELQQKSLLRAA